MNRDPRPSLSHSLLLPLLQNFHYLSDTCGQSESEFHLRCVSQIDSRSVHRYHLILTLSSHSLRDDTGSRFTLVTYRIRF